MENRFYEEMAGLLRLRVPFEALYTSVFLIKAEQGIALVDCATTDEDVDGYILPALREEGLTLADVDVLVLSHKHSDHAGGRHRILELVPKIEVVTDERMLFDGICTYALPGHLNECIGVLDTRTNTLIACDGLQGAGVDKYRCSLQSKDLYRETIEKIERDSRIENLLFSHAYEPWNCDKAIGREAVLCCLEDCLHYVK